MLNKVYQSKFKGDRQLGNMTYNVSSICGYIQNFPF